MDLVEMAQTLSVFFVPVWDFHKQTTVVCRRCSFACPVSNYEAQQKDISAQPLFAVSKSTYGHSEYEISCRHCGSPISNQWKFCPTCGVAADYQGK
jgi:Fe-S-cluster-containing dehydrogenase component